MMNNEEFDRKMEFIVNQQAKFEVDIELLRERQDKTSENIDRLFAKQAQFDENLAILTAKQEKTEEVVTRLAYVTSEGFKDVNTKINALVDSQMSLAELHKETEEKLNRFLDRLDRRFNNGSNTG